MNMHVSARNPNRKNVHKGGSGPLISTKHCYTIETGQPHYVLDIPKSINTQSKFMKRTSPITKTMVTSQKSTPKNSQTLTCLSEDFLAKVSALLANAGDSQIPEGHSFLTSLGFSKKNNQDCVYWKTSKDFYLMTTETLSKQSSPRLQNWGMISNGRCVTARISESHKIGKECSLLDILEEHPDQKYFLSKKATQKILKNLRTTECKDTGSMTKTESTQHSQAKQGGLALKQVSWRRQSGRACTRKVIMIPSSREQSEGGGRKSGYGTKQNWDSYLIDHKIRRLTPVECARLQGFPDDWHKVDGISDTQAYKVYGNAVSVPVIKDIVEKLLL